MTAIMVAATPAIKKKPALRGIAYDQACWLTPGASTLSLNHPMYVQHGKLPL